MTGAELTESSSQPGNFPARTTVRPPLRFDRHELAGAFGDIGTDLPLLVGLVLATGMDAGMAFAVFGVLQITTGVIYRLPMPVQPLKAMAAIAIAGRLSSSLLAAGGLIVGVTMLTLALSGALERIAAAVPKTIVRAIQVGLGIQLARLSLTNFIPSGGTYGWVIAGIALALIVILRRNRHVPASLVVLGIGFIIAAITWPASLASPFGLHLPTLPDRFPTGDEFARAALLLAVPQIALSLGNSVLATRQVVRDLFPEREPLTVKRIGITYAAMNLVAAPIGGIPVCHGSGGIAGHHAFGARTGGSAVYYGVFLLAAAFFLVGDPAAFQRMFPGPVLGALLLVEAIAVLILVRDLRQSAPLFGLAIVGGAVAAFAPYGYAIVLVIGTIVYRLFGMDRFFSSLEL